MNPHWKEQTSPISLERANQSNLTGKSKPVQSHWKEQTSPVVLIMCFIKLLGGNSAEVFNITQMYHNSSIIKTGGNNNELELKAQTNYRGRVMFLFDVF